MSPHGPGHRLLHLACERGLISREQLDAALAEANARGESDSRWGIGVEDLVRSGVLEPSQVVRLARELGDRPAETRTSEDSSPDNTWLKVPFTAECDSADLPSDPLDPLLDIALDPVILEWDRYEIGELLGQGGMGCVYRARDTQLERDVALKFLRRDDPEQIRRFRREARSQARVDHPNVCRVYEVGEIGRHVYIAMQFVKGQSLVEAGLSMTLNDKVAVSRDVARAVHAAHDSKLIHRDLKPANVMVERRRDGWHPYVLDFGIAREQHQRDVTETGMVMGTLTYLSPEQARGEVSELDRRSDVYGLGATLYAVLAGCPPFPQSVGAEIVWRVVHEDPRPLRRRNPEIPADVETIVMKCLEKEPERRYQTAGELADDLERFLAGEPIHARPASVLYKAVKKIRKHRTVAAIAALALLVVVAAVVANVRTVHNARLRSAVARRLAQEVNEMEGTMRIEAMLPLHDSSRQRERVRARMNEIAAERERLGSAARGPTDHALGRGHLLLGNHARALEHLLAAWKDGYRDPADSLALGRAYAALYQEGLEELEQITDPELRQSRRRELERRFRDEALRHLRSADALGIEEPAYVEGLIAFLEERYNEALDKARQASAQVRWLHEAKKLAGDIHRARARQGLTHGEYDRVREESLMAADAYAVARDVARSDATVYEGECSRWLLEMEIAGRTGGPADDAFAAAVTACQDALRINPESVNASNRLSRAHWMWASHLIFRGDDPGPHLEAAVAAARKAAELDPENLHAHYNIGCALNETGARETERGGDPRESLDRAIASFTRALEISPAFAAAYDDAGFAHERKGKYEIEHGIDPSRSLQLAVASYRAAIDLSPDSANVHNNLGIAFLRQGTYAMLVGADPERFFDHALDSFQAATELNPNYANAHTNIGYVYRARGQHRLLQGLDPTAALDRARQAFAKGEEINPALTWSLHERAAVELVAARWAVRSGENPEVFLTRAAEVVEIALRLNPANPATWLRGAQLALERARWDRDRGRRPFELIGHGLDMIDTASHIKPGLGSATLTRAELLAEQARLHSEDSARRQALSEAQRLLDQAREENPLLERECARVRQEIAGI